MTRLLLIAAALALSGCARGQFDRSGDAIDLNRAGAGASAGALAGAGGPSDPTSSAYFQQRIGDRVLFAVDQSTVAPEAQATLDGQAQWLLANPSYTAMIEGHADEQGTREYNLALGGRRANAVRDYLITRGVPAARLDTVSFGKERPIEVCSEEACYARNRRAVTVLAAGAGT